MLTLIIGAVAGFIVAAICAVPNGLDWGWGWGILPGMLAVIAVHLGISLLIRRKIKQVNNKIQELMMEVRHKVELKQQQFMRRPVGSQKMMMDVLEKEQNNGILAAVEACDMFEPFFKWNFILKKQTNTMKMAFYYQLKDYEKVDQLLPKCLLMDSQSLAMKLARLYKKKDPSLDKFFRKKCSRAKGENAVLLYSLYAWILVKQDRVADAIKTLVDARKKTDSEIITSNWEHLVNGRVKHFSNSGLGEIWYALNLEEMKAPKVKQQHQMRGFRA